MALRIVVEKGDPQLERKSRKIDKIDDRMKELAVDLVDTMREYDGVGIAAPQVGVNRCMCVVSFLDDNPPKVLINPEIVEKKGSQICEEGCLSVPGYLGKVERPQWIKLKYQDLDGVEHVEEHENFGAVVVSHEIDHLHGELFDDKAVSLYTVEEAEARAQAEAEAMAEKAKEVAESTEATASAEETDAQKRKEKVEAAKKAKAARKPKKKNKRR